MSKLKLLINRCFRAWAAAATQFQAHTGQGGYHTVYDFLKKPSLSNDVLEFRNYAAYNDRADDSCVIGCLCIQQAQVPFGTRYFHIYHCHDDAIQVTLVPNYITLGALNLLGTFQAIILPGVSTFGVFLLKQFMTYLPDAYCEAGKIDGRATSGYSRESSCRSARAHWHHWPYWYLSITGTWLNSR